MSLTVYVSLCLISLTDSYAEVELSLSICELHALENYDSGAKRQRNS